MNLYALLEELRDAGIDVSSSSALALNVARELKISLFPKGSDAMFLRVVDRSKGDADFANLRILGHLLGARMVPPDKVVVTNSLACGVFPFIPHVRASYGHLSQERYFGQVTDTLVRLHAGADRFPKSRRQFDVAEVLSRLDGEAWSKQFFHYVSCTFRPIMAARSGIPQHCDFTYVNLGIDDHDTLRVFDWEDFGAIRYAGFDLATFVFSHLSHSDALHVMANDPSGFANKVRGDVGDDVLASLGFTAKQFTQVFPGYLALFMGLKKQFGDAINRKLMPIWAQMMRSEQWQRVLGGRVD